MGHASSTGPLHMGFSSLATGLSTSSKKKKSYKLRDEVWLLEIARLLKFKPKKPRGEREIIYKCYKI